mgnify:CR=1 FL=1
MDSYQNSMKPINPLFFGNIELTLLKSVHCQLNCELLVGIGKSFMLLEDLEIQLSIWFIEECQVNVTML